MRPQTKALYFALIAVIVVVGGCTVAKISGRGAAPILLNQPPAKVEVIEHIKTSKMIVFDYTSSFDASEILGEVFERTDADAIINVTFTVKTTVGDFFINFFTLGLAQAKTMEISGDAIKAPEGLGSLSVPGGELLAESGDLEAVVPRLLQEPPSDCFSKMIVRVGQGEAGTSFRLIRHNLCTDE